MEVTPQGLLLKEIAEGITVEDIQKITEPTLIHEMKKRQSQHGLASLCIGGGMGTAIILKNV